MCSTKVKYSFILFSLIFAFIGFAQTNQPNVPLSVIPTPQGQVSLVRPIGSGLKVDFSKPPNIQDIISKANSGDPYYQGLLGLFYYRGYFVQEDKIQAEKWLKLSAKKNHPFGNYGVGVLLFFESDKQSQEFFQKAFPALETLAESGDAEAQCNLGYCYQKGNGVAKDPAKAVEWYQKAAAQGYVRAQVNLGVCYEDGEGVPKDLAKAVKWYQKAAAWFQKATDQGYANALLSIKIP